MMLVPSCRPIVGIVHSFVPEAVPLPPQLTLQVTRVTLSDAVPLSGTVPAVVSQGPLMTAGRTVIHGWAACACAAAAAAVAAWTLVAGVGAGPAGDVGVGVGDVT